MVVYSKKFLSGGLHFVMRGVGSDFYNIIVM